MCQIRTKMAQHQTKWCSIFKKVWYQQIVRRHFFNSNLAEECARLLQTCWYRIYHFRYNLDYRIPGLKSGIEKSIGCQALLQEPMRIGKNIWQIVYRIHNLKIQKLNGIEGQSPWSTSFRMKECISSLLMSNFLKNRFVIIFVGP